MCLLFIAHQQSAAWPLILAANRDEFHQRPSRAAGYWPEQPHWLGGRDLAAGGSWLLLDTRGRLAALTNVRNPAQAQGQLSRGGLVTGFLASQHSGAGFFNQLPDHYAGFNLLTGIWRGHWQWHFASNGGGLGAAHEQALAPGLYGLSNASLDSPWPKVREGKQALRALLDHPPAQAPLIHALWALLADERRAADAQLPSTGLELDTERLLSARFIRSPQYGTRASSLLLADGAGQHWFMERRFDARGRITGESVFEFSLPQDAG